MSWKSIITTLLVTIRSRASTVPKNCEFVQCVRARTLIKQTSVPVHVPNKKHTSIECSMVKSKGFPIFGFYTGAKNVVCS